MSVLQRLANARRVIRNTCSQRKRKMRYLTSASNEYKRINGRFPIDVPKGHFAVYVGKERSRFIVPTSYLNHPLFQKLLEKAKEEYGFHHNMGLNIPCDRVAFEYVTSILRKTGSKVADMKVEEI